MTEKQRIDDAWPGLQPRICPVCDEAAWETLNIVPALAVLASSGIAPLLSFDSAARLQQCLCIRCCCCDTMMLIPIAVALPAQYP